jgi:hypothetical protein
MSDRKRTFYIAARVANADLVAELTAKLVGLGLEPLFDWSEVQDGIPKPYLDHKEINAAWAEKFKEACLQADVTILLHYDSAGMRGAYIELGIAYGAYSEGKQIIWATSLDTEPHSIFMCAPVIRIFDGSFEDFKTALPSLLTA